MPDDLLKILLITSRADYGGGPEHVYRHIANSQGKVRYFIACPDDFPYYQKYRNLLGENNTIIIKHRKFTLKDVFRLKNFVVNNKIDLIHSHGKGAGSLSRIVSLLTGRKSVHSFHGIHIDNYSALKKTLYIIYEKLSSFFTDVFIATSDSEKEKILGLGIIPENKIQLIYNGVNIPDSVIQTELQNNEFINISHVTRFDYAKNPDTLIDIVKSIISAGFNKFIINIAGDGEERKNFEEKISSADITDYFKFLGNIAEMSKYYLNSKIYISTSRWEGLPLSVLEAMSYGIPVIISDVTGNRDIIKNGENGFLYSLAEPEKATEYFIKLINDKDLFKNISLNSIKTVKEKFSVKKMANETIALYYKIAEK